MGRKGKLVLHCNVIKKILRKMPRLRVKQAGSVLFWLLKRSSCFDLEITLDGMEVPDEAIVYRGLHSSS